jgi:hypothetical protein
LCDYAKTIRILHHSTIVNTNGESFRLKTNARPKLLAAAKKGAKHLDDHGGAR